MKKQVRMRCYTYASKRDIFKDWKKNLISRELAIGEVYIPKLETKLCYGFKVNKQGEFLINTIESEVVQEIFYMHLFGKSIKHICDKLTLYKAYGFNLSCRSKQKLVKDILRNELYAGYKFIKDGNTIIEQRISKGIINKTTFAIAQELALSKIEKSQQERLSRLAELTFK